MRTAGTHHDEFTTTLADLRRDRRLIVDLKQHATFGHEAERDKGNSIMFRKLTVALIASALLAAPVLAQTTMPSTRAPATAVKITHAKPVFAKAHKVTKIKKHKAKKVKAAKHTKHVKHMPIAKHGKHFVTSRPATHTHHN